MSMRLAWLAVATVENSTVIFFLAKNILPLLTHPPHLHGIDVGDKPLCADLDISLIPSKRQYFFWKFHA